MRALVTGSAGFVGRHMVRELEDRGWDVYGIDPEGNPAQRRGKYIAKKFAGGPVAYQHSLYFKSDAVELFDSGVSMKFDLVVHCAYHVGGRAAIDGTNTNFAKNLQLDASMFEWAIRTKQKRVLYFSSSAAYPSGVQQKDYIDFCAADGSDPSLSEDLINFMETTTWTPDYGAWEPSPDSNYGWAKLTGERLAADARKNGLAVTVVRPFSGYGEDQSLDYPFPSIIKRASQGDLNVWGPKGQTRDWIHVSDVIAGALAVVESETTDPVNLCTGRGVEMGELMRMAYAAYPGMRTNTMPSVIYDETKPTGVFYRVGDPTRMLQHYKPRVSVEDGIQRALKAQRT